LPRVAAAAAAIPTDPRVASCPCRPAVPSSASGAPCGAVAGLPSLPSIASIASITSQPGLAASATEDARLPGAPRVPGLPAFRAALPCRRTTFAAARAAALPPRTSVAPGAAGGARAQPDLAGLAASFPADLRRRTHGRADEALPGARNLLQSGGDRELACGKQAQYRHSGGTLNPQKPGGSAVVAPSQRTRLPPERAFAPAFRTAHPTPPGHPLGSGSQKRWGYPRSAAHPGGNKGARRPPRRPGPPRS
jgi:hypothetical protein